MENPDMHVRLHDWWRAPLTAAAVHAIDPVASHASWMENFPWTRLPNRRPMQGIKRMVDVERVRGLPPFEVRILVEDGNFGGRYQRDDSEMLEIWGVAVRGDAQFAGDLVMPERILIWGAGAIGGSVGAWLKRAGHDVTFVDVDARACRGDLRRRPADHRPGRGVCRRRTRLHAG